MFLALPALAAALATGGSKSSTTDQEPRYDPATVVDLNVIVVEVREVAKGNPMAGVHLMSRPESARGDSESLDVYIGPTEFLKQMDLVFHARDKLEVVGSKVKVSGATIILSREVRRDYSTLYIRDSKGEPIWKAMLKDPS
jgi:hypothetical protein